MKKKLYRCARSIKSNQTRPVNDLPLFIFNYLLTTKGVIDRERYDPREYTRGSEIENTIFFLSLFTFKSTFYTFCLL